MRLAPELRFLERIPWQVFVTLTFRGRVPRPCKRERWLRAWLKGVARSVQVPFDRLDWVVRDEMGERFGRPHFHVLIGRIPSRNLHPTLLYRAKSAWRNVGFSDLRMWLEGLGALEYIGEDGENCYEASKFCGASGLLLSESLLDMAGIGDTGDSGWRVEHDVNPNSGRMVPDMAGMFQRCADYIRTGLRASNQMQRVLKVGVKFSPRRLGMRTIAAKATDQGIVCYYEADITGVVK